MDADPACTCGEAGPHIIARRSTVDGKHVCLWNDGALTWALGYHIKGGMRPRTKGDRAKAIKIGRLVLGEICLHRADAVSELIAAARWAVARDGLPGTLRRRFYSLREDAARPMWLKPVWQTYQADRDGKPIVRVWRMHRLSPWVDHIVWHERGRYELLRCIASTRSHRDECYAATGIAFATIAKMTCWLAGNQLNRPECREVGGE